MIAGLLYLSILQQPALRADPGLDFAEKTTPLLKEAPPELKAFILGYSLQRANGIASGSTDALGRAHVSLCAQMAYKVDKAQKPFLDRASILEKREGFQKSDSQMRQVIGDSLKSLAASDHYSKGDTGWSFASGLIAGDASFCLYSFERAGTSKTLDEFTAVVTAQALSLTKIRPSARLLACAESVQVLAQIKGDRIKTIQAPLRQLFESFLALKTAPNAS